MIQIRCSRLHEIMGEGKTKAEKDSGALNAAARTYLDSLAHEYVYNFREEISGKEFEKGIACESALIGLYNEVFFTSHTKNTERKTIGILTGEPDILVPATKVIDVKNAFSLATFPGTKERVLKIAEKSGYDWQLRGYMRLFDIDLGELAYGVVSTPEELMKPWYQTELHQVDHIDPALRITRIFFERDKGLEDLIDHKLTLANEYVTHVMEQIAEDHLHDEQYPLRKAA